MRRWTPVAACVLAISGLAGCLSMPDGVDGDITDDWQPMPAATQFRPQSGTCHPDLVQTATADKYSPVSCTGPHLTETVAVADLAAEDQAFRECSRRATAFLGDDWRTGWVVLQPVLPSRKAWTGGAHWVRCDVAETSPIDGSLVRRSSSMKGGVKAAGKLRMACANPRIEGDSVTEMHPVACATGHTAEFAGLFETTKADSADLTNDDLSAGCDAEIARFAKVPNDSDLPSRVGWLGFPPDDTAWEMGDRAIRCFLWLDGEKMKGSYRNAGTRKLKIHYAN